MKNILWISPYAPYDSVAHGGGKTHNFYIKHFNKSKNYDITLLSMCLREEEEKIDLDKYGIKHHIYVMDKTIVSKSLRLIISGLAFRNPFERYGAVSLPYERYQMQKLIREYHKSGQVPDLIILQWTFAIMLIDELKQLFPMSKIVAVEEDVTFLNYERRKKNPDNTKWQQFFWNQRYKLTKAKELDCLEQAELIVTNNKKDTALLMDNGVDESKVFTAAPHIEDYLGVARQSESKDIVFYGAMSRPENYLSAIWFIEKVFPYISDKETRFVIVGANPHESLTKYQSDRIVITGFVEDAGQILADSMCMAAPLVGGAGIKIKVLEAMSAGVPVLTNEIGIEGIGAVDRRDYLHCEKPEEYVNAINAILAGEINVDLLSKNAKTYIKGNYNLEKKLDELMQLIEKMTY